MSFMSAPIPSIPSIGYSAASTIFSGSTQVLDVSGLDINVGDIVLIKGGTSTSTTTDWGIVSWTGYSFQMPCYVSSSWIFQAEFDGTNLLMYSFTWNGSREFQYVKNVARRRPYIVVG